MKEELKIKVSFQGLKNPGNLFGMKANAIFNYHSCQNLVAVSTGQSRQQSLQRVLDVMALNPGDARQRMIHQGLPFSALACMS